MDNIALNTIFYVMIFIFPGILFRKFYFGGEFTKQFQQGNLMERVLWTVFFSVIIIFTCILLFLYLENHSIFIIQDYISYDTIKKLFDALSTNKLPEPNDVNSSDYLNFLYLIIVLYFISAILGFVCYRIIRISNIDKNFSPFRFKNYWHYLIQSNSTYGNKSSKNKHLFTNADVLVEGDGNQILYSGYLKDYFIDSVSNKLDCIVLKDAVKFITVKNDKNKPYELSIQNEENIYEVYKRTEEKTVYTKRIKGDVLTLFNEKIININLTYVKLVKPDYYKKNQLKKIIGGVYYIIIGAILLLPWIIKNDLTNTFKRKIIFGLLCYLVLTFIKTYMLEILDIKNKSLTFSKFLLILLFLLIPFTWFFKYLNMWWTFLILLIYFFILVAIIGKRETGRDGE